MNYSISQCKTFFKKCFENSFYDQAYEIDVYVMEKLVKQSDSEALWREWQSSTYDIRKLIVAATKLKSGKIPTKDKKPTFLIYCPSGLAHEIQLRSIINTLPDKKARIIYAFNSPIKNTADFYAGLNIDFLYLQCDPAKPATSIEDKLSQLEKLTGPLHITIITTYVLAFWASVSNTNHSYGFFAMRFIPYQVGSISRWLTGGVGNTSDIYGQPWMIVTRPWVKEFEVTKHVKPQSKVRIGSISRESKIDSPGYLSIICNLLEVFPEAEFALTGRTIRQSTLNTFRKRGLESRVMHLGWIEPSQGMSQIDLYLEPFPFGGGEMLYQAIANRIPFVYLAGDVGTNLAITDSYLTYIFSEDALRSHRALGEEDFFMRSKYILENLNSFSSANYWNTMETHALKPFESQMYTKFIA